MTKENVWLGCIALGPITAYAAVFWPTMSLLAIIFLVIGLKGIIFDIM